MKNMKRYRLFIYAVLLMCIVLIAGCGNSTDTDVADTEVENTAGDGVSKQTSMLDEAELDYEIPATFASIMVDRNGYEAEDEKIAVIVAENLPAQFQIVDAFTDETVYTGQVKKFPSTEDGDTLTGHADFSDFTEEGEYYIRAEIVGSSENFRIKKGYYSEMLSETFMKLDMLRCDDCHPEEIEVENTDGTYLNVAGGWHTDESMQRDVAEGCLAVMDLCVAYEYNSEAFGDDSGAEDSGNGRPDILDEVIYESSWLMKMQNPETGGVYASVSLKSENSDSMVIIGETTKATAYFCAAMARNSYVFESIDSSFSKKTLKAANAAWNCLEANRDIVGSEQMYMAAAEMYRATGYSVYRNVIEGYLSENADKEYEDRNTVDAALTYMATPAKTNVEYCTSLMANFMSLTEDKTNISEKARFLVAESGSDYSAVLRDASELVIVDYIISTNEYTRLEQNCLHYLGGRNEKSEILTDCTMDPVSYAGLITLLGKLSVK